METTEKEKIHHIVAILATLIDEEPTRLKDWQMERVKAAFEYALDLSLFILQVGKENKDA